MTFTPSWQKHFANTDAEMHRMYVRQGLSRMRIAKIYDCRSSEVKAALIRHKNLHTLRASAKGGVHRPKPVTLAKVTMERDQ